MSECTNGELRDLLPELVNGRLSAEMRHTVEAHVASCAECAEELALLRSLRPALMRAPAIDTDRIAAAVRAHTGGAARPAPVRGGIATRWKVAIAAAALIAVGTLGYAASTRRASGTQSVAVTHTPTVTVPRTAPVQTPPQRVAMAPPRATPPFAPPVTVASTGVLDNLSDLSDDDVRTLTASLDTLSSVPDADPSPGIDPLGASLDDLSAGGSR
jgi:anti-sigma factor RsiW